MYVVCVLYVCVHFHLASGLADQDRLYKQRVVVNL